MASLTDEQRIALENKAADVRETIIRSLVASGERGTGGHTAGSLDMADIFTAFYFHILKHDPKNPDWPERDRLILSNGHIAPVRYAAMAHAGYFPVEECLTLRAFGSRLQGHPERDYLPGLETTSGPLGSGLSESAGIAYALRMDEKKAGAFSGPRVYCLMSDGELQEGNSWEGAMFAGANRLANLTAIIDRNNIQITGDTEDIMPLEPLADKWKAFGWHVLDMDGHNMEEIVSTVEESKAVREKPTVIIAHTIPGKGVKEIEGNYEWHGKPPSKAEEERFIAQIRESAHE
ncbi:MAG: transketolase [Patescibacteria group bacterium]|nr:transketolase [Patescibacteria group bacterium]